MLKIGAHMSVAKGLDKAALETVEIGADTMQFFSRNPRGSSYKTYKDEEVENFRASEQKIISDRFWRMLPILLIWRTAEKTCMNFPAK